VPAENRNDRVALRLGLDPTDPDREAKEAALEVLGLDRECLLAADGVLPTAFANAAVLWHLASADFRTEATDFRHPRFESRALTRIADALEETLANHPTTLEDDSATLPSIPGEGWRRPLVAYRVAYKRVLHEAHDAIRARAAGLRDGTVTPGEDVPVDPNARYGLLTVPIRVGGAATSAG